MRAAAVGRPRRVGLRAAGPLVARTCWVSSGRERSGTRRTDRSRAVERSIRRRTHPASHDRRRNLRIKMPLSLKESRDRRGRGRRYKILREWPSGLTAVRAYNTPPTRDSDRVSPLHSGSCGTRRCDTMLRRLIDRRIGRGHRLVASLPVSGQRALGGSAGRWSSPRSTADPAPPYCTLDAVGRSRSAGRLEQRRCDVRVSRAGGGGGRGGAPSGGRMPHRQRHRASISPTSSGPPARNRSRTGSRPRRTRSARSAATSPVAPSARPRISSIRRMASCRSRCRSAKAPRATRPGHVRRRPVRLAEDFTNYDRCITRGIWGSVARVVYGNGNRIVQAPGMVAISYEMIHDTRVIYTDGRPHINNRHPSVPRRLARAMGRRHARRRDDEPDRQDEHRAQRQRSAP